MQLLQANLTSSRTEAFNLRNRNEELNSELVELRTKHQEALDKIVGQVTFYVCVKLCDGVFDCLRHVFCFITELLFYFMPCYTSHIKPLLIERLGLDLE